MAEFLPTDILGSSGLKRSGGFVLEEPLSNLRGLQAVRTYKEMRDNASVIGAIRFLIRSLARQVDINIEPADQSPAALEQSDFVEQALGDMSNTWDDLFSEALTNIDFGWAFSETVYKLRKGPTDDPTTRSRFTDGKWGWRKMSLRGQETLWKWDFDDDGSPIAMWQMDTYSDRQRLVRLPFEKGILFRTETTKNNPEGRSLYRNAVYDWFFLKRIQEIEAIGIERDATGVIVMEMPIEYLMSDAPSDKKAIRESIEKGLSEFKRDEREFLVIPPKFLPNGDRTGFELTLLKGGGARQMNTGEAKMYYRTSILQSALAQFLALGQGGKGGSESLSKSHTATFATAMGTMLNGITSPFTRYGIHRLMELNVVHRDLWPHMSHGKVDRVDMGDLGTFVKSLTVAGIDIMESESLLKWVLSAAGFPMEAATQLREAMGDARLEE